MKKLLPFFIVFYFTGNLFGQNLVPNPSFEIYTLCPFGSYQIDKVVSWSSAGGSPDYFNSCATAGGASVPANFCGYQNAANGAAYIGLYTFNKGVSFPNNREHIQASLINPLSVGTKYYVSFDVSFTLDNIEIGYASDKLGVLFTNTTTYSSGNPPILNNNSQVFIDTVISDTLNWFHCEGSFIADSAYQNIMIGNFFSDTNTNTMELDSSLYTSYYFIDNICVSSDSTDCLLINSLNNISDTNSFNIFPNPSNSDIIHLQLFRNLIDREIKYYVINNIGQIVIQNSIVPSSNTFSINLNSLPPGLYFIKIQELENQWIKKLIIN